MLKDLWDIGKAANLLSLEQAKKIYFEPVIYYNLFIKFHLYNMIYWPLVLKSKGKKPGNILIRSFRDCIYD